MGRLRDERRRQEQQESFLAAFARTGVISIASKESPIPNNHYRWLQEDEEYAARFFALREETAVIALQFRNSGGTPRGYKYVTGSRADRKREAQDKMLRALEIAGLVGQACELSGVPYTTHFAWLKHDNEYAEAISQLSDVMNEARRISRIQGALTTLNKRLATHHEGVVAQYLTVRNVQFNLHDVHTGWELDIYIPGHSLNIEVDNSPRTHIEHYVKRDEYLSSQGIDVVRVLHASIDANDFTSVDASLSV